MATTNGHAVNGINGHAAGVYHVNEQPLDARRKLRVVFIGAGASGITWHHRARDLDWLDYQIYEKNDEIGGTWYENKYPGAGCDIPSFAYQFLFKTNPRWSQFYAKRDEIFAYFKETAADLDFLSKVKLNSRVTAARFDANAGTWHVEITDTKTGSVTLDVADLLVNGGGVLNSWKWPDIPQLHEFKGKLMHSAAWDETVNCSGKRIAVIGSGSSGIQMVPQLRKVASSLTAFNRSKNWILPGLCADLTPDAQGNNFHTSSEEMEKLSSDRDYLMAKRKYVEHELQASFKTLMFKDAPEQIAAQQGATELMRGRLGGDEQLLDRFLPKYHGTSASARVASPTLTWCTVRCKRPTPGEGYLEAFLDPDVNLVTSPIVRATAKGLITADGVEHEFDIIACATGFETTYSPRYPIVGTDKTKTLAGEWSNGPRAYMGLAAHGYPNLFHIYGPYAPVSHGSFFPGLDLYVRYILAVADKMSVDKIKSIAIKERSVNDFMQHANTWLPRTAWASTCTSWYKRGENGGIIMWPGTMPHCLEALKAPRFEHYDFEYIGGNTMGWLGSGIAFAETIEGGHLTGFLDEFMPVKVAREPAADPPAAVTHGIPTYA